MELTVFSRARARSGSLHRGLGSHCGSSCSEPGPQGHAEALSEPGVARAEDRGGYERARSGGRLRLVASNSTAVVSASRPCGSVSDSLPVHIAPAIALR